MVFSVPIQWCPKYHIASQIITDRHFSWGQWIPITDTESRCQKNWLPLGKQICGNVCREFHYADTESPLNFNYPERQKLTNLVAQSSATGVTVAATPPVARSVFGTQQCRDSLHQPAEREETLIWGGVAQFWRDISGSAGIWCDTLCATLCSAIGVSKLTNSFGEVPPR